MDGLNNLRAFDAGFIDSFHGERVEYSSNVPTDLGGSSDLPALIYGEWPTSIPTEINSQGEG